MNLKIVLIGFAQLPEKLVFAEMFRRAYVMTPPTRYKFSIGWLNGKWLVHTVGRWLSPAET